MFTRSSRSLIFQYTSCLYLAADHNISILFMTTTEALISNTLQEKQMNVHLEPKYAEVCEGASVTMTCTFQPNENYILSWHYSQTPILDCRSAYKIPEEQRFLKKKKEDWSTLNITFIKANESGWYFCLVTQDIPVLIQHCSNGIQVLVTNTCRITACIKPKDNI